MKTTKGGVAADARLLRFTAIAAVVGVLTALATDLLLHVFRLFVSRHDLVKLSLSIFNEERRHEWSTQFFRFGRAKPTHEIID